MLPRLLHAIHHILVATVELAEAAPILALPVLSDGAKRGAKSGEVLALDPTRSAKILLIGWARTFFLALRQIEVEKATIVG